MAQERGLPLSLLSHDISIEALYFKLGNEKLSNEHAASTLQARNIPLHALSPICHCRRDVLSE